MIKKHLALLAAAAIVLISNRAVADERPARPNVIVIVADDMGYSDAGCFGGELDTPTLDQLAHEGVRFTRCYNAGMCVVSRASLLTGHWWPRALRNFTMTPLLSETLQDAGYRTALIGKWHLPGHPMDRGFDHFFGFLDGFADHFSGAASYRLDREPFQDFPRDYYSSDAFTDRAISFVKANSESDSEQPFMLYLSFQAPHNPLQAPREDILKHRGKYRQGWQSIREARFERQKDLGIVSPDAKLPSYPLNLPDWNSLSPQQRDLEDLRMSVYAAMIERMDRAIGRLLDALHDLKQADDTLLLFLSDNGTDSFSVVDKPMLAKGKLPGDRESNWQPGTGWAYASVTPWRLYKIGQHGGGVTTGAIAWWPAGIESPGRIEHRPIHMIDIMPTILSETAIRFGVPVAGQSFHFVLRNQPWRRSGPLFFQYMDNRAIRTAGWTLAEVDGVGWELFRVEQDPYENENVIEKHPEIRDRLADRWGRWWREESDEPAYSPKSTINGPHYRPQGDRGSGVMYAPTAMPSSLKHRYPLPTEESSKPEFPPD